MSKIQYCKHNHDTSVVGLDTNGYCRQCKRERDLRYWNKKMNNLIERLKKQTRDRIYWHERKL